LMVQAADDKGSTSPKQLATAARGRNPPEDPSGLSTIL
jgi:hypothetical protein